MPYVRDRNRTKLGLAVVAAVVVAISAGIGTAEASTRKHWWGAGHQREANWCRSWEDRPAGTIVVRST
jgi:hypothetical protein